MIERLTARFGRFDKDREVLARLLLPDEFGEALRTQGRFEFVFFRPLRRDDAVRIFDRLCFCFRRCHDSTRGLRITLRHFPHGLKTVRPSNAKSLTLRVTSVNPWTSAVAAIWASTVF